MQTNPPTLTCSSCRSSWCSLPGLSSVNISANTLALDSTTSNSLCNFARCSAVNAAGAAGEVGAGGAGWCGACRRGEVANTLPTVLAVGGRETGRGSGAPEVCVTRGGLCFHFLPLRIQGNTLNSQNRNPEYKQDIQTV